MASILIIDDDGFYRGVLRRVLEDGGHQVIECSDGQEALEIYGLRHPDLVITDIFMPGMDGSEVIRALKEVDDGARIIAVSGGGTFYDIDVLDMAKKLGANAILRKLDPKERVLGEIERVLKVAVP
ncbi:MAG TPA: response regulator [Dongiaceae bacterium]|nr:response regulator [Dongiaceae bacterium]